MLFTQETYKLHLSFLLYIKKEDMMESPSAMLKLLFCISSSGKLDSDWKKEV